MKTAHQRAVEIALQDVRVLIEMIEDALASVEMKTAHQRAVEIALQDVRVLIEMIADALAPTSKAPLDTHGRRGHWLVTFTGKRFYPLDPRPEDVDVEDIAHHLSLTTRFGGATRELYSVAQHAVLVALEVERRTNDQALAFWGLHHDSAEAYVGDVVWPLKRAPEMAAFSEIEEGVMVVIADVFGLAWPEPPAVKAADLVLLATEKRDLMPTRHATVGIESEQAKHAGRIAWDTDVTPLERTITPWLPTKAEREFLYQHRRLGGR